LVKDEAVTISDNYIVVNASYNFLPSKLFERKTGKYISDIGAIGQGPGEYGNVYYTQIDERYNCIYLMPLARGVHHILSYDLRGNFKETIDIKSFVPKCIFTVNGKDSIITLATLPFSGMKTLVWKVKNGNVIYKFPVGNLAIPGEDFNNEIYGRFNNEGVFDFHIFKFFEPRADSLYHYDIAENKLTPVFTLDFGGSEITTHMYVELPLHYMGYVAIGMTTVRTDFSTISVPVNKYFIVNKKTLKSSYFRLKNDFLGDIEINEPGWHFKDGYFFQNYDPSVLFDDLEKTLASNKKLSEKMRTKLTALKDSINVDKDNNYILYAKLKNK
jgi:hypothetical protein